MLPEQNNQVLKTKKSDWAKSSWKSEDDDDHHGDDDEDDDGGGCVRRILLKPAWNLLPYSVPVRWWRQPVTTASQCASRSSWSADCSSSCLPLLCCLKLCRLSQCLFLALGTRWSLQGNWGGQKARCCYAGVMALLLGSCNDAGAYYCLLRRRVRRRRKKRSERKGESSTSREEDGFSRRSLPNWFGCFLSCLFWL